MLFDSFDWDIEICWDEVFGDVEGDFVFGCEICNDIVLINCFCEVLFKLNEDILFLIL